MEVFSGVAVNNGIVIEVLYVYKHSSKNTEIRHIEDTKEEILRFEEAKYKAIKFLENLYEKAINGVGETDAAIIEVHRMMINDIEFVSSVKNKIELQKVNAEYAVNLTAEEISRTFSSMEDTVMKERVADIRDAAKKVVTFLGGDIPEEIVVTQPAVLLADDLTPSETFQLDRKLVRGFVTQKGTGNSHTAILARNMGIPAIVGSNIELKFEYKGKLAILDGYEGKIILEPTQKVLTEYRHKQNEFLQKRQLLQNIRGKKSITADGRRVDIYANIGTPEDVFDAVENDAEGIGLFRSEFLYLGKEQYPSEEEQFIAYKTVAEKMAGKKVIIRTMDIGADKKVDYFNLKEEENPALGYRSIRICLERIGLFKTQLRAIYRAATYGTVAVMFPMIISLEEVLKIKAIMKEVTEDLKMEGIPFKELETGIMIETPAAAILSDILAGEVDFFSIGTNDLIQYVCAIDRQNQNLDSIYNPHHPAVLRLIETVAKNAHEKGIRVGICGELASDTTLTETFIDIGIDELSVSPGKVLELRKEVISTKSK